MSAGDLPQPCLSDALLHLGERHHHSPQTLHFFLLSSLPLFFPQILSKHSSPTPSPIATATGVFRPPSPPTQITSVAPHWSPWVFPSPWQFVLHMTARGFLSIRLEQMSS